MTVSSNNAVSSDIGWSVISSEIANAILIAKCISLHKTIFIISFIISFIQNHPLLCTVLKLNILIKQAVLGAVPHELAPAVERHRYLQPPFGILLEHRYAGITDIGHKGDIVLLCHRVVGAYKQLAADILNAQPFALGRLFCFKRLQPPAAAGAAGAGALL